MTRPHHTHLLSASALSILIALFVAGCGEISQDEISTDERPIWTQTPGMNTTAEEMYWETVSSAATGAPALAAASFSSTGVMPLTKLNAFWLDTSFCLHAATWYDTDGIWSAEKLACGWGIGSPAAISWDTHRVDLFYFLFDSSTQTTSLRHWWRTDSPSGSTWLSQNLGTTSLLSYSAPAVASWGDGHIDVMWRDSANNLKWREYNSDGGWSSERTVLTGVQGDPTIAERKTGAIQVFWRNPGGDIKTLSTTDSGATWSSVGSLNVQTSGKPVATARASGSQQWVDIFYPTTSSTPKLGHVLLKHSKGLYGLPLVTQSNGVHASALPAGNLAAAASLDRTGRIDLLSLGSNSVSHAFYSEPLEKLKVYSRDYKDWCWIASSVAVMEYIDPTLSFTQCIVADKVLNKSPSCCIFPSTCGGAQPVEGPLDAYSFTYTTSGVLSMSELRAQLYIKKQPIITFHDHYDKPNPAKTTGGHYAIIRDAYHFDGKDFVVIGDNKFTDASNPTLGENWVMEYQEYIKEHCAVPSVPQQVVGCWKPTIMLSDFAN
jgi:hypothetical protein